MVTLTLATANLFLGLVRGTSCWAYLRRIEELVATPNSLSRRPRPGFLPIGANHSDGVNEDAIVFVAVHLLWMRFLEAYVLDVGTALLLVVGWNDRLARLKGFADESACT